MKQKYKGFTLLELLVVMGVIAILMAVSAIAFISARKTARDAKRKTDLEQIRGALETFKADKNYYPYSGSDPACDNGVINSEENSLQSCLIDTGYLLSMPNDPVSTKNYYYKVSGGNTYALCASLEGGSAAVDSLCTGADCGTTCNYAVKNP